MCAVKTIVNKKNRLSSLERVTVHVGLSLSEWFWKEATVSCFKVQLQRFVWKQLGWWATQPKLKSFKLGGNSGALSLF
jgi:hypothetical protein